MLEPCALRNTRTVLRGLGASNGPWLPDENPFEAGLVFAALRVKFGHAAAAARRLSSSRLAPPTCERLFAQTRERWHTQSNPAVTWQ
jgi:hypothetical protein